MFKGKKAVTEAPSIIEEPDPDITLPPSKKQKLSDIKIISAENNEDTDLNFEVNNNLGDDVPSEGGESEGGDSEGGEGEGGGDFAPETVSKVISNDEDLNKKILSLVGDDFASVPAKIDEMSKTMNAIKASVDLLQAKSVPHIAEPSDVEPKDDRIENLVLCKSLEDILKNFTELTYNEDEQLVKCDLCCFKSRMGGNVPGLFKYEGDPDTDMGNQSQRFRSSSESSFFQQSSC